MLDIYTNGKTLLRLAAKKDGHSERFNFRFNTGIEGAHAGPQCVVSALVVKVIAGELDIFSMSSQY